MGKSKIITGNLAVVKGVLDDLEDTFDAFEMDKYWNKAGDKLTIAFTCEKLKIRDLQN